jgi:1,4-dihydroxy-2-naphthoate octaprenyltransferase
LAIRPKTLPAAIGPIAVGSAVAINEDGFHLLSAFAALTVALLLQIVANLANDVFDFRRGADVARLGPARMTQSGAISPREMYLATGLALALAIAAGLELVWRGGWPILLLGVLAALAAVGYTAGPLPLGYHGLGDLFVFIFFGVVGVAGSAYVQTRDLTWFALAAAVPSGCLVTAIIVVNNLRDIETDRAAGKRTLAVRLGREGTILEYRALFAIAYLMPLVLWIGRASSLWWWIPWISLPLALPLWRDVSRVTGRALNPILGATARLSLVFALLLALSLVLA